MTDNNKHTPGSWFAEWRNGCWSVWHWSVWHIEGMACIADAHRGTEPDPTGEANARLIAAAPDLLEACEAALGWFGAGYDSPCDPGDIVRSRMRAAIKKARVTHG